MADPTLSAIDRFFDLFDKGVDAADRLLNRSKHTDEQLRKRSKREVIDASPVEKSAKKTAASSTSTAVAKKPYFYIMESVDQKTGNTIYVVTDGGNARTEAHTREFAEQILRALEKG